MLQLHIDYSLQLSFVTGFTAAQLTNTTSCIGDDVTYTCNVNSVAHTWNFGEFSISVVLGTPLNQPLSVGVYTLERVFGNSSLIVSTLSVTAFAELNGTQISCTDASVLPENAETQTTTAIIYGEMYTWSCM